ncbi:Bacterial inner-membrane translocator [marine sediment metagenome]|uniref:Bacterial inner-membrane translocator n=1 Tax=marine sediment metagenome TaxID=412755 RepID=A0A1B6NR35_9ZZZZ
MTSLFLLQLLNGVQLGVLLFLIAAGLTLVFGIMDFVNLAHGVIYMVGAYLVVMFAGMTGSYGLGPADPARDAGHRAGAGGADLSQAL